MADADSNFVRHARRELELLHEDEDVISGLCNIVQAFADMGHSGGSIEPTINLLDKLLRFENLTPLTNNPDEWEDVGHGLWQSRRNPAAFSDDGGKHFRLTTTKSITYASKEYVTNG